MIVTLPWAPRILWPNGSKGHHWAKVSTARVKQGIDAALVMGGIRPHPLAGRIRITLTFCPPPKAHRFDLDGALGSQKRSLDQLAKAMGVDDSRFDLDLRRGDPTPGGAVIISIGEAA